MAPTDRAPYYHGLRVHLQIVIWKMLGDSDVELKLDIGDAAGRAIS